MDSSQITKNGVPQQEEANDENLEMDEDTQATERLTSDSDLNKVKFTTVKMDGHADKNGEVQVDIKIRHATVGMGKEELMKYANEPYWVRLRMFLFVLFWVCWVAMLVGAVAIILLAPRCPPAPHLEWHQKTTMYRVSVKSFKDSDDDGIGDIKGLTSKLDYLKDINVGTVLLSAFYAMAPSSGGILNHTSIDSKFGTMTDFEHLVTEMKNRDMKLVIDLNPNHSSDKHPWFEASVRNEDLYQDYYVWHEGAEDGEPPNNWVDLNDESAWEWNQNRQQYYLHTMGKGLPEFNLRNPHVRNEVKQIMEFWLQKGVDGFTVLAASHLVEDDGFRDEPLGTAKGTTKPKYEDISHSYTVGQTENFELFAEWRQLLNNFSLSSGLHKVLLADVSESVNRSMLYYGNASHPLSDFPINVELTKLTMDSTGKDLSDHMKSWMSVLPEGVWPNWKIGGDETDRLAVRVGQELLDGIHMVATLAKGTPITYYGDELGISYEPIPGKKKNILNESPMQWNHEPHGGFTESKLNVHLNPDYQIVNVEAQQSNKSSHLKIFSHLLTLRDQPAISLGIQEYPIVNDGIFSLLRVRKGSPGYLVVVNMGGNLTTVNFVGTSDYLPDKGRVEVRSLNIQDGPLAEGDHPKLGLDDISLAPKQAVVFSFVPVFKD